MYRKYSNYITNVFIFGFILSYISPRIFTQIIPYIMLILLIFKYNLFKDISYPSEIKYIFYIFIISLLSLFLNNFFLLNFIVGWFTFFSGFLIFILAYSFGLKIDIRKLTISFLIASLFQIPIGILQLVLISGEKNILKLILLQQGFGDYFTGTYFAPLKTTQIVSCRLSFAFIITLTLSNLFNINRFKKFLLTLYGLGIFLAETNHITVVFIISLLLYYIIILNFLKKRKIQYMTLVMFIIGFIYFVIEKTRLPSVEYVYAFIKQLVASVDLSYYNYNLVPRKILALIEAIKKLPRYDILNLFFGVGIGNFSSYASQTGNPEIIAATPFRFEYPIEYWDIIYPKWNLAILSQQYKDGIANQPWFTYMTIFAEMGILSLVLFINFIRKIFLKVIKIIRNNLKNIELLEYSKMLLLMSIFFFLIMFFDNYIEDPRITVIYFTYLGVFFRKLVKN